MQFTSSHDLVLKLLASVMREDLQVNETQNLLQDLFHSEMEMWGFVRRECG